MSRLVLPVAVILKPPAWSLSLQLTQSWRADKTDYLGPDCTQEISTTRFGLLQENTLSSMSLRDITDGAKFILTMNNDMEILKDMLKESIKDNNEQQKEMKKQIEKIDKKMEETIKLQHLETRR